MVRGTEDRCTSNQASQRRTHTSRVFTPGCVKNLHVSWFQNLFDARRKIAAWRSEYNEQRPHSSLGYRTPNEFAELSCGKDGDKTAWKTPRRWPPAFPTFPPLRRRLLRMKFVVFEPEQLQGADHHITPFAKCAKGWALVGVEKPTSPAAAQAHAPGSTR